MRKAGQRISDSPQGVKEIIADEIRQALLLEEAAKAQGYRSWADYQAAELNWSDPMWDY